MRICIFGAGAVGSHFAVRLALAGHEVSCVMRGPHLAAVKANGLTLSVGEAKFNAKVKASDDPAALGPQDLVISTLKATGSRMFAAIRVCDRARGSIGKKAARMGFGTSAFHQFINSRCVTLGKKSGRPTMQ